MTQKLARCLLRNVCNWHDDTAFPAARHNSCHLHLPLTSAELFSVKSRSLHEKKSFRKAISLRPIPVGPMALSFMPQSLNRLGQKDFLQPRRSLQLGSASAPKIPPEHMEMQFFLNTKGLYTKVDHPSWAFF